MQVHPLFDPRTGTLTYVVWDPATRDAVVVDPVLDFDPASGRIWTESVDRVFAFVREARLHVHAVLETHVHADHLSGSQAIKARYGVPVLIGRPVTRVQATFAPLFGFGAEFPTDGSQFDRLLDDGEGIEAGSLRFTALATPGHTPACMSFLCADCVFTGDALFLPDSGVGRCDFPAGNAKALFESVTGRLYTLPPATRVFVGHDYQPGGRGLAWESTIAGERARNIHIDAGTSVEEFVAFRVARDATLGPPRLLLPSVQVNIAAGQLPPPAADGRTYLRLPLRLDR